MKMKIAIDVSPVIYGTGVSVYTSRLVENLLKIDTKNIYLLFGGSLRRRSELITFSKKLKGDFITKFFYIPPTIFDVFSNRFNLVSVERFTGNIDVYHSSDWAQFKSNAFNVTTVHDLAPILLPKQTHPKIVSTHKRRISKVIKEADRIIVPSISTKNDLAKLGVQENRIRVIHEALSLDFSSITNEDIQRVKHKFNLNGNYSLSIGSVKRKNLKNIIQAFEKAGGDSNLKQHVIVGSGDEDNRRGVRFTGRVTDRDLMSLYKGADVLVYASLYEGFGLPILEAFAAGIPVVTSNISSMPEIAGDAGVLVDPMSVEDITNGINKAIKNKKDLVRKGKIQLKKFSWEKAAYETLKVYEERQR